MSIHYMQDHKGNKVIEAKIQTLVDTVRFCILHVGADLAALYARIIARERLDGPQIPYTDDDEQRDMRRISQDRF